MRTQNIDTRSFTANVNERMREKVKQIEVRLLYVELRKM